VDVFLLVGRRKPHSFGDFSLSEALATLGRLEHNIVTVDFIEPITAGFDAHEREIYWDVGLLVPSVEVLLHQ